ncbi:MAG: hypothetical protein AAF602_21510 [Myxococcota bacterium]
MSSRSRPWWLLVYPILVALWSTAFSIWSAVDATAMYAAFGLDVSCDSFAMGNSVARYAGIAVALWLAILVVRTPEALLVAMVARHVMDLGDVVAGLQVGLMGPLDLWQPFLMFLGPEWFTIGGLIWWSRRTSRHLQENRDRGLR